MYVGAWRKERGGQYYMNAYGHMEKKTPRIGFQMLFSSVGVFFVTMDHNGSLDRLLRVLLYIRNLRLHPPRIHTLINRPYYASSKWYIYAKPSANSLLDGGYVHSVLSLDRVCSVVVHTRQALRLDVLRYSFS